MLQFWRCYLIYEFRVMWLNGSTRICCHSLNIVLACILFYDHSCRWSVGPADSPSPKWWPADSCRCSVASVWLNRILQSAPVSSLLLATSSCRLSSNSWPLHIAPPCECVMTLIDKNFMLGCTLCCPFLSSYGSVIWVSECLLRV